MFQCFELYSSYLTKSTIHLSKPWRNRSIIFLVDKFPNPIMPQVSICIIFCPFVPTNHSQSFLFLVPGIPHPTNHVKRYQRNNKTNASFKLIISNKYSILSLSLQLSPSCLDLYMSCSSICQPVRLNFFAVSRASNLPEVPWTPGAPGVWRAGC